MKFMITIKEKPNNHPINVVHRDLESFILYNDIGLNDVDSQLVEIKYVLEIFNCIRIVSNQEKEKLPSSSKWPSDKVMENLEQYEE